MEVTDLIGETGTFQNLMLVVSMYRGVMLAINNLGASFLFPPVGHWCSRHPAHINRTIQQWKELAIPRGYSGMSGYESCWMYAMSDDGAVVNESLVRCQEWEYDHSEFWPSGTEKWSLVCEDAWKNSLPQSMYMTGMTVGFLLTGRLSDLHGRRPVLLCGLVSYVILEYAMAFVPYFWLFCFLRLLSAASLAAVNSSLTLYIETIGPGYRSRSMIAYGVSWGVGVGVLAGISSVVPRWDYQIVIYASMYIAPLLLWRYIIESPKWLMTAGRYQEAERAIWDIARLNGRPDVDRRAFLKMKEMYAKEHKKEKKTMGSGVLVLFNSRTMIKFTLTNVVFQFCAAIVRYNLALSTDMFPVDAYLNYTIGAAIEVVSGCSSQLILLYAPRKKATVACLLLTAVSYVLLACAHKESLWVETLLMLLCRLCIGNAFNINIIYLSEMVPTSVRALATGAAQTVYGIGCAVQPFLSNAFENQTADAAFHAVILFLATAAVLPWMETRGKPLPDFVAGIEDPTVDSVSEGEGSTLDSVSEGEGSTASTKSSVSTNLSESSTCETRV
ncbi:solute carrier family 22 member 6-like [Ixodes scapularis]|uniref:solute carrier family 22 member 6-like n=1 Tax=Ixodes scapularis TaxID=6945 RepID=UPI001AD6C648|nr:solute carrier family 22 member 6-like [Ixodes scapularis]